MKKEYRVHSHTFGIILLENIKHILSISNNLKFWRHAKDTGLLTDI